MLSVAQAIKHFSLCTKAPTQNWLPRTAHSYPPHKAQETNPSFKEKSPFFDLLSDAESLWREKSSLVGQCVLIWDDRGKKGSPRKEMSVPHSQHAANLVFQTNRYISLFRSQKTPLYSIYLENTALCRDLDNPVIWSTTQRCTVGKRRK